MEPLSYVCTFSAIMDVHFTHMLERLLIPFIQQFYSDGHRFMQDNDPKHCSYSTIILSNQVYYLCKLKFCDKGTTFVMCIISEIKFKMWAHEGAIRVLNNRTTYFHFL